MKKLFAKLHKYVLTYVIIFFLLFIITKNILNAMDMDFLKWIYITSYSILFIGTIIGFLQIIIKAKNKILKTILILGILSLLTILSPIWILKICLLHDKYEYIINKENEKFVAEVININNTTINYYNYINCFIKGTKIVKSEYFQESGLNPFNENN